MAHRTPVSGARGRLRRARLRSSSDTIVAVERVVTDQVLAEAERIVDDADGGDD